MDKIKAAFALLLIFTSPVLFAQQQDSARVRLNHYTFTVGVGWSHYIDNFEYGNKDLKQDFAAVGLKFYWEPEFRLSLGLESGYYKMFRADYVLGADTSIEVSRTVVPLLLLVRMRIVDNVYLGAGMGLALITNKSKGSVQEIVTKTTSMSNFELSGAYIYPLSKRWLVGGEAKMFSIGSMEDWMYSVQATFTLRL